MNLNILEYRTVGEIPPILRLNDGTPVINRTEWDKRRAEMAELAVGLQFGGLPPEPEFLDVEPIDEHGWGEVRGFRVTTGRKDMPIAFNIYVSLPEKEGKYPVVVDGDPGGTYLEGREEICDLLRSGGVIYAAFDKKPLAPDEESERDTGLYALYPGMKFSCLSAWAWGYHRTADALIKLGLADGNRFAYTGHSRGGKTALLAGATDARAAIVNPAGSGCGGAGLYHVHMNAVTSDGYERRNERLDDIVSRFGYWFSEDMKAYIGRDAELPFDQHWMAALVAPRFLLMNEGVDDLWASPVGTYRMMQEAKPVFDFLGVPGNIRGKWRPGGHSHNMTDWKALLDVIDYMFFGKALPEDIDDRPEEFDRL